MGTATEINDYLRLLYARVGTPYCINGHGAITASSVEQIVDKVLELPERQRLQILAPVIRKKKGQHKTVFDKIQKDGYVRVRVDGDIYDVTEVPELSKSLIKQPISNTIILLSSWQPTSPLLSTMPKT